MEKGEAVELEAEVLEVGVEVEKLVAKMKVEAASHDT